MFFLCTNNSASLGLFPSAPAHVHSNIKIDIDIDTYNVHVLLGAWTLSTYRTKDSLDKLRNTFIIMLLYCQLRMICILLCTMVYNTIILTQ